MKNQVRNLLAAASGFAMSAAAFAQRTSPMETMLDEVDLTGLSVKIIAVGVLIVGIALAFKGPDLAKRVIRKV